MGKFRKKPDYRIFEPQQFFAHQPLPRGVEFHESCGPQAACHLDGKYFVVTIHGQQTIVTDGDWIMPEPDDEHFYAIKPDIFEATYRPADMIEEEKPLLGLATTRELLAEISARIEMGGGIGRGLDYRTVDSD